jgi:hypothetical protein
MNNHRQEHNQNRDYSCNQTAFNLLPAKSAGLAYGTKFV